MLTVRSLPQCVSAPRFFGQVAAPEWATHVALITGAESLDNIETFERMVAAVASERHEEVFDAWQLGIKGSRERVVVCWFRKSDADATVLSQSALFALTRSLC